jgi:hypothetical protein
MQYMTHACVLFLLRFSPTQAKKTNARLEASGFKLDTKEEEASRLSDAMSSFSYDSIAGKGLKSDAKNNVGRGYKNTPNSSK